MFKKQNRAVVAQEQGEMEIAIWGQKSSGGQTTWSLHVALLLPEARQVVNAGWSMCEIIMAAI